MSTLATAIRDFRVLEPAPEHSPAHELTRAMSEFASGVVLVTCGFRGRPWGMTTSAFASVSDDPPTVLVSLASESASVKAITASGRFGVNILADGQERVARWGSSPGAPKFIDRGVVSGALAYLDCKLVDVVEVAGHTVLFGAVVSARLLHGGEALIHHRGSYRTVSRTDVTKEIKGLRVDA